MSSTPLPIPDGSVVITPNQQYAEMQLLRQSVDKLINTVDPAFTDIRKRQDDHETRIRGLERKVWVVAGFASGAGGAVGGVLSKLLLGG